MLGLRDRVRSSHIWRGFGVEPPLLPIERSRLKYFGCLPSSIKQSGETTAMWTFAVYNPVRPIHVKNGFSF